MKKEIWRPVVGYEGLYEVSNFGRIKSLGKGGTHKTERILSPALRGGYLFLALYKNGVRKQFMVHIIVWTAFNGQIPEGYEINHIDENKTNPRLDNLELVTHIYNVNYGTRNNRVKEKLTNRKDQSKAVKQLTLNGELVKIWPSRKEVERELGYFNTAIGACCNGKTSSAYGYRWENC